jgi:hypothetical protein
MHDSATALHKERWVEIVIRHDGFIKMLTEFAAPFAGSLLDRQIVSSFYYYASPDCNEILVLNFKTTPFRLDSLKSSLFSTLQVYFGPGYLASLGVNQLDETVLERKAGFISYDWKNIRILGIEEFSFNRFPFTKGTFGKEELSCLMTKSSELVLDYFKSLSILPPAPESLRRKRFDLLVPVLRIFLADPEERFHFCTWHANGMKPDHPEGAQMAACGNAGNWEQAVIDCRNKLEDLDSRGLLYIWEYKKDDSDIGLQGMPEKKIRNWRVVAYLLDTISGQFGVGQIPVPYKEALQVL